MSQTGVALVTGAAKRIGRAIALDLVRLGYAIGVHYHRSAADAEALVTMIRREGGRAIALTANLANEAEVHPLVAQLSKALGPVTCLVNNASLFEADEALTVTKQSWDAHLATNLRAPFVLIQEFTRHLPETEHGNVINLLDQRVWNLTPHFVSYTVSKFALWGLTQSLALALAPRIRVNAIGPGPTLQSTHQTAEQFAAQARDLPLGHGAEPAEIVGAIRFILQSPSLTGQMIALDGGQHLRWRRNATDLSMS